MLEIHFEEIGRLLLVESTGGTMTVLGQRLGSSYVSRAARKSFVQFPIYRSVISSFLDCGPSFCESRPRLCLFHCTNEILRRRFVLLAMSPTIDRTVALGPCIGPLSKKDLPRFIGELDTLWPKICHHHVHLSLVKDRVRFLRIPMLPKPTVVSSAYKRGLPRIKAAICTYPGTNSHWNLDPDNILLPTTQQTTDGW